MVITFVPYKAYSAPVADFTVVSNNGVPAPKIESDGVYVYAPSSAKSYTVRGIRTHPAKNHVISGNYNVTDKPKYRIRHAGPASDLNGPHTHWTINFYDSTNISSGNLVGTIVLTYRDFSGDSPTEPEPTPDPTPEPTIIDYSEQLTSILNRIGLSNSKIDIINSRLNTLRNSIDSMNTNLSSKLNTVDSTIKSVGNTIGSKLDNINNQMTTSKPNKKNTIKDYSNTLKNNKPNQPISKFEDNKEYFTKPTEKNVSATMPNAPSVKDWDGVNKEENLTSDSEISQSTENSKDSELSQSTENSKDSELSQSTENSKDSELSQSTENSKDSELSQSTENSKDSELSQSTENSKDSELSQNTENSKDSELLKDSFNKTQELNKGNFQQNNQYNKDLELKKDSEMIQENNNGNLRWKSINGEFQ